MKRIQYEVTTYKWWTIGGCRPYRTIYGRFFEVYLPFTILTIRLKDK